ncbi:MAG: hypothetical protein NZ902_06450 [Acidilobaceae archaeon]|nr:hypothetical protein [Acidilobaceae archaeon]
MASEADLAKSERYAEWERNLDFVEGKQWNASNERPAGLARVTINSLWRLIRQEAALLTDAKPTVKVIARNSKLFAAANTLNKLVQAVFQREHVDLLIVRVVFDLAIFGVSFVKVYWDPAESGGQGEIKIRRIDPRTILVDDVYRLEEAQYIGHFTDVPLVDVRRRFPARGHLVQASTRPGVLKGGVGQAPGVKYRGTRNTTVGSSAIARADLYEWWIRDPSLEGDELRYPRGRLITVSGGVVLQDTSSPYILQWPGPWVKFSLPSPQDTAWPPPAISHLVDIQHYLNLAVSNILDQVRFVTQGVWISDADALMPESRKKLMTPIPPATLIEKAPGKELRWERLGDVSPTALALMNNLNQFLDFVYGMMDVSYGRVPRGVVAGAALEQLQLTAQSIVRLNAREIERGLTEIGQRVLGLILQFYPEERVEALLGPGGDLETIEFRRSELFEGFDEDVEELYYQFKFVVRPDSTLSMSREKEYAAAMALYGAGLLDRRAALELIDIPNKEQVFERLKEMEQMEAMAALSGGGVEAMETASGGPRPRGRGVEVLKKLIK